MKKLLTLAAVVCLAGGLLAHPHFAKTVTVDLADGVKATVSYRTTPANETHAKNAAVGSFVTPRGPSLTLSGDVTAGSMTIAAGEYTIGVIKNSETDWTMALYPGRIPRGEKPDTSKLIKLTSVYKSVSEGADHMRVDIIPGHGALEGKMALSLEFGSMWCEGALS